MGWTCQQNRNELCLGLSGFSSIGATSPCQREEPGSISSPECFYLIIWCIQDWQVPSKVVLNSLKCLWIPIGSHYASIPGS